jgi:hypothetical protein
MPARPRNQHNVESRKAAKRSGLANATQGKYNIAQLPDKRKLRFQAAVEWRRGGRAYQRRKRTLPGPKNTKRSGNVIGGRSTAQQYRRRIERVIVIETGTQIKCKSLAGRYST